MGIKSQKDFFAGLLFLVVGIAFALGARTYNVGTGARMGPGYFPLMLGVVLAILGAVEIVKALIIGKNGGDKIGKWAWRPIIFVLGANLAFGVLLGGLPKFKVPAMGLILGIYALVIIASLAGERFKIKDVLILATILAIGSYLAFIVLLKLQIPVWPTFITG
jgi:Tripartite tricarboxylate transporter TctB family